MSPSSESEFYPGALFQQEEHVLLALQYGLSKNKNVSSRTVYNLFDLVSDLGGIQGSLVVFGATLSAFYSPMLMTIEKTK